MNQSELIEKVAQATELNQAAAGHAVKAVVNAILDALLAGDAVRVSGLGIFNVAARPAREGQTMRLTEAGAIKVFGDVRSGRTMERPGLEALLAYAREGDTLAVVRLDRLGRSLGELLTTVAMLKERGIALLSLEERIDTNSAAGELVFHVFGAIAHFERRLIAERTKDGIAAARPKGKHPGRRPLDADKIAAALSLVKAGLSPTAAAKQLGLGRSTVYREVNRAGIERYPAGARSLETAVGFASGELDA
jgi:DNA invertase Pin-like site-specific DNA recombinase